MTSAVLPSIYYGVKKDSYNLPLLHSLEVSGILIVTSADGVEPKLAFPQAFAYHILCYDGNNCHLNTTVAFIRQFIESIITQDRATVFVYDDAEPLRAAFVLALYVMDKYLWPFARAWKQVQPGISPSLLPPNFLNKAREMEAVCQAQSIAEMEEVIIESIAYPVKKRDIEAQEESSRPSRRQRLQEES